MGDRSVVWEAVAEERRQLVRDLEGIALEDWQTPSLCPGWSVHDVLAHLIDSATTEDIRRPLAIQRDYPREHVMTALEYMASTGAGLGGGRARVLGLRLSPHDVDRHIGAGPVVRGSAIALLLAASGRPIDPDQLSGAGAQILAARD